MSKTSWHPIDSAPKDGSRILIQVGKLVTIAQFNPFARKGVGAFKSARGIVCPIAWQPLPEANYDAEQAIFKDSTGGEKIERI